MLHGRRNKVKQKDKSMNIALSQMIRGYKRVDLLIKRQAALPLMVLRKAYKEAASPRERHHANLLIEAFFFGYKA